MDLLLTEHRLLVEELTRTLRALEHAPISSTRTFVDPRDAEAQKLKMEISKIKREITRLEKSRLPTIIMGINTLKSEVKERRTKLEELNLEISKVVLPSFHPREISEAKKLSDEIQQLRSTSNNLKVLAKVKGDALRVKHAEIVDLEHKIRKIHEEKHKHHI